MLHAVQSEYSKHAVKRWTLVLVCAMDLGIVSRLLMAGITNEAQVKQTVSRGGLLFARAEDSAGKMGWLQLLVWWSVSVGETVC